MGEATGPASLGVLLFPKAYSSELCLQGSPPVLESRTSSNVRKRWRGRLAGHLVDQSRTGHEEVPKHQSQPQAELAPPEATAPQ